jgi:ribosomal protein L11 methylase PrmA
MYRIRVWLYKHGEVIAGDPECRKVNFNITQAERKYFQAIETIEDLKRVLKEEAEHNRPSKKTSKYRGVWRDTANKKWHAAIMVSIHPVHTTRTCLYTHIYRYILLHHS